MMEALDQDVATLEASASGAKLRFNQARFGAALHLFAAVECARQELGAVLARVAAERKQRQGVGTEAQLLRACVFLGEAERSAEVRGLLQDSGLLEASTGCEWAFQPLASGAELGLQLWWVVSSAQARQRGHLPVRWYHAAPPPQRSHELNLAQAFRASLDSAMCQLEAQDCEPADIIRTWIYIGDINGNTHGQDHYQSINEARRTAFQEKFPAPRPELGFSYPASTGIGAMPGSFSLSALACRAVAPYRLISLENRQQTSAFEYPQEESRIPPLFSRAAALQGEDEAFVFISGTASIVAAASRHLDSIEQQTLQTLANIESLLMSVSLGATADLEVADAWSAVRTCVVYVKHPEHAKTVTELCRLHLPGTAAVSVTVADVCRGELLVEIEAIAVFEATA
jgi:enamine deaminase RidA (YjgF/YER057c/UK114 family)